jgi:FlaG/FlaF family flagellin (archaellin)
MISLKKNDKIIIVVAVVVILLASIGVAMYQSPKTTNSLPQTPGGKTYEVEWKTHNGSLTAISEFAGKRSPYETTVQIAEGNLKTITFNMTWVDDHATFFKRFGLDTLTIEVTTPDGEITDESNISAAKTREGNILLTVTVDNIRPPNSLTASDIQAAQAKLKEKPFYDDSWTNKDITIKVSVNIGEKRILAKLLDKGNSFDLDISYSYSEAILKEDQTKNTGADNDTPPEDPWEPPYMSMIINTGCGRFV